MFCLSSVDKEYIKVKHDRMQDRHPRKFKSHPLTLANSAIIATEHKIKSPSDHFHKLLSNNLDCWDRGALHEYDEYLMVLGTNKHEFNLIREQKKVY